MKKVLFAVGTTMMVTGMMASVESIDIPLKKRDAEFENAPRHILPLIINAEYDDEANCITMTVDEWLLPATITITNVDTNVTVTSVITYTSDVCINFTETSGTYEIELTAPDATYSGTFIVD